MSASEFTRVERALFYVHDLVCTPERILFLRRFSLVLTVISWVLLFLK